jgi:hypothetical protein
MSLIVFLYVIGSWLLMIIFVWYDETLNERHTNRGQTTPITTSNRNMQHDKICKVNALIIEP